MIELLIVVAIISLLMGILMPSLGYARKQSRATACGARLRTLGQAWTMYSNDNGDRILPARLPTFQRGGFQNPANQYEVGTGRKYRPRWPVLMQKQVGVPALNAPSPEGDRQDYESPAYLCTEVANWSDERNAAYGYNYQFLGNQRLNKSGRERNPGVPSTRIPQIGRTVVAGDSNGTAAAFPTAERLPYSNKGRDERAQGNAGWALDPPRLDSRSSRAGGTTGRRSAPDPRHLGKCNILFGDGHVSAHTLKQLGYAVLPDGRVLNAGQGAHNQMFSGTGEDKSPP